MAHRFLYTLLSIEISMVVKTKKIVLASIMALLICSSTFIIIIVSAQSEPKKPDIIPLGDYSYVKDYTDSKIEQIMRKYHVPGVAVSLLDENETILEKYYGIGNTETKEAISNETTFKIGSISKVFTAIEIMRLVDENLIDLDDPIVKYLPTFNILYRFDSEPITVRHLLSHRSGLPRNDNLVQWHWDTSEDILKTQMESLNTTHASYPAGHRYKYSNVAYNILGHLIEQIRGRPFIFYMVDQLFHQIGMENSHYLTSYINNQDSIATGYFRSKSKTIAYEDRDIVNVASGGILSTMKDMQAFFRFLNNQLGNNYLNIIQESTLFSMYNPQFLSLEDPQEIGLGFFIDTDYVGKKVVFHTGVNLGRRSIMAFIPETKQGVILMGNHEEFSEPSKFLAMDVLKLMLETKTGEIQTASSDDSHLVIDSETPQEYVGSYVIDGDLVKVFIRNDKLKLRYQGFNVNLNPIGQNSFQLNHFLYPDINFKVSFIAGNSYEGESDMIMLVNMEDVHNIYCPRIRAIDQLEEYWDSNKNSDNQSDIPNFSYLSTTYALSPRIYSKYTESDDFGEAKIQLKNSILHIPILHAVLMPLSESELIIMGGEWDGETMYVDPETGVLTFQHLIFTPE